MESVTRIFNCIYLIWVTDIVEQQYTELFISRSGISELDCATTKTDMAERSISTERERHYKFLSYLTGARYVHPW